MVNRLQSNNFNKIDGRLRIQTSIPKSVFFVAHMSILSIHKRTHMIVTSRGAQNVHKEHNHQRIPTLTTGSPVPKIRKAAAAAAKSLQSCPTLCDPIDGSPPGSVVLGFSRQEYWSGLPFPSPMHESKK